MLSSSKLLFLLARRFLLGGKEQTITTMTIVSFISIMLGAFALALVMAVMNGFEKETHKVIQGVHPDLTIASPQAPLNYPKIKQVLQQEFSTVITGTTPSAQANALIKSPESTTIAALVMILGIDPQTEPSVSKLHTVITDPPATTTLETLVQDNKILLGATLAQSLLAKPGDKVTLLFAPEGTPTTTEALDTLSLEQMTLTVGGIFKTGIDDIDGHVIFTALDTFKNLFPNQGISHIGIRLKNPQELELVKEELTERFNLSVHSWRELYPALIAALTLEKYAMFLVLALITLVASMNIISLLFMYITQKRGELALLRTLGMTNNQLVLLFTGMGVALATVASILGILLAVLASFFLKRYPLIKLPDVYYVSHLPAHMSFGIILSVLALVITISLLASYFSARRIRTLDIAAILKQNS